MKLVYDGNNTAYRANCTTELYTKQGERVSAILGTINSIRSDIDHLEKITGETVEEIYVVWDHGKSKRRMTLHPEYKGNRRKDQTSDDKIWYQEFLDQVNYLHENLHSFGIKSLKVKGWEADDLIYGMCEELEGDIVVVSTDEDMLQLISPNVTVFSPIKRILINNMNFFEKIGVQLQGFLTFKVIKGDSSDNINGIQGIGDKTGKSLVNKYKSMDGILANRKDLMKSKRYARIFTPEGLRLIDRNNRLINLSYVNYEDIRSEITDTIRQEVFFNSTEVLDILKSKQFVSVLSKFKKWSAPFQALNVEGWE